MVPPVLRQLLLALACCCLAFGSTASAAPTFSSTTLTTGTGPTGAVLADLDADGNVDLATANWGTGTNAYNNTVSVLKGDGAGSFAAKTDYTVGTGPRAITTGDFNGDGKTDLATANYSSSYVSILLNNGSGGFTVSTTGTRSANGIAAADLNADGKTDLVTADAYSSTFSVYLGTGSGTFGTAASYSAGSFTAGVAVADFNGDGKLDVAAAGENDSTISVRNGNGDGTFGSATSYLEGSNTSPASIAAGDLNGDGRADLVTADAGSNQISVRRNTGTGSFATATPYATGGLPTTVALKDIDGDGRLDAITGNQSGNTVSLLLGSGSATFGAKTDLTAGTGTAAAIAEDVNKDGLADIVGVNGGTSTATLFRNTSASPCITGVRGTTSTFSYSGTEQCFVVPAGVATLHVVATGASGRIAASGGLGAVTTGDISVTAGQIVYVNVGGSGFGTSFNGGGLMNGSTASGGGASDVRICSRAVCALTGSAATDPRLIVAGGGGGTGIYSNNSTGGLGGSAAQTGGAGGNSTPAGVATLSTGGGGGTASAAGAGGTGGGGSLGAGSAGNAGSAGYGGAACPVNNCYGDGGAGGGGWWGGGSGGNGGLDGTGQGSGGGGGGAGSSYGPALATYTTASASGDGSVTILPPAPVPSVSTAAAISGAPVKGIDQVASAAFSGATSTSYLWQRCDSAGANCTGSLATTATYTATTADVGVRLKVVVTGTNSSGSITSSATTAVIEATRITTYAANGTATDAAGNYDGTWSGTAAYGAARSSAAGGSTGALSFDGTNSIAAPAGAATFAGNDWTLSAWVKASAVSGSYEIAGSRAGCAYVGVDLRLISGVPRIEGFFPGGPAAATAGSARYDDGAWHELTGFRSGGTLYLAVDGVVAGSNAIPGGATAKLTAGGPMRIGGGNCVGVDGTLALNGLVDDVVAANGASAAAVRTAASISGTPTEGQTLTGSAAFTGTATTTSYAWDRCDSTGTACTSIGATTATYTPGPDDVGHTVKLTATGTNAVDTASTSATSAVIASANTAPIAGGDRAASATAGSRRPIDVAPTLSDPQGTTPAKARITAIPSTFTLERLDGSAIAAGDDVDLVGGRLKLQITPSTPADASFAYSLVDATDSTLLSPASNVAVDVSPGIAMTGGPADGSASPDQSPSFAFSGAGAGGSYVCTLDGTAGACSSPAQVGPLKFGAHTFRVKATDADGDTDTVTIAWTVSGSLGAPTIIGAPSAENGETTAALQFQTDAGMVAQCSLDGATFDWCASPLSYRGLAYGRHTFSVRQVDAAGDVSPAATVRWRSDVGFKPMPTDGANIKSVQPVVNDQVAPADQQIAVGCKLNAGSLRSCDVAAYADVSSLRTSHKRREADVQQIGSGSVTLPERGQSSAVVSIALNALGQKLVRAHPEGVQVRLDVSAWPFDSDAQLQSRKSSTMRPPQMLVVPSRGMFAGDSYTLIDAAQRWVAAVAQAIDGARKVRCEGYSDNSGTAKRAKALGYLRAKAVCAALADAGVAAPVSSVGLGSDSPRGSNTTSAGRFRNRRVEIRVWF